jgi:hypothetical protein
VELGKALSTQSKSADVPYARSAALTMQVIGLSS